MLLLPHLADNVLASDSFTRANSTSIGKLETGQTWVNTAAPWGVSNGQAYVPTPDANLDRLIVDVGTPNFSVTVVATVLADNQRILFRYVDTANELYINMSTVNISLNKRVANALTSLATINRTPVAGDIIRVICRGNSLTLYVNGTQLASVTDATFNTATKVGLALLNTNTARFDNFLVEAL